MLHSRIKSRETLWVTLFFAFLAIGTVSAKAQACTSSSPTWLPVTATAGICGNQVLAANGNQVNAYLGIPYTTQPPTGANRWMPATMGSLPSSTTSFTTYGSPCMQANKNLAAIVSENCLYLNVWMPGANQKKPATGWPVMIFIHGGAFIVGSGGNQASVIKGVDNNMYNGTNFASQGVILVTLNYRLGAFGFYGANFPNNNAIDYNLGLRDQQAAIQFALTNLGVFGGNSNLVSIFGESAGAMSVSLHTFSVLSNVKSGSLPWQGAIMESNPFASNYPQLNSASFVRANDVNTAFLDYLCMNASSPSCTTGPMVTVSGGGGTGAVAVAIVGSASTGQSGSSIGQIMSIKVISPGTGYPLVPTATLVAATGSGAQLGTIVTDPSTGGILSIAVKSPGSGYSSPQSNLSYLQSASVSAASILAAETAASAAGFIATGAFNLPWTPVVDSPLSSSFVTSEPFSGFQSGTVPISVGFGVNQNEGAIFSGAGYMGAGPFALGLVYPLELSTIFGNNANQITSYQRYAPDSTDQTPFPAFFDATSSALSNLITDYGMWCSSAFAMNNVSSQITQYNQTNSTKLKVYGYLFSQQPFTDLYNLTGGDGDGGACEPNAPTGLPANVCHANELPYVFNTLNSSTVPGTGSGATASATLSNGAISNFTVANGGAGYSPNPGVSFPESVKTATGIATVMNGAVTMISLTSGGSDYVNPYPHATISAPGTGKTATAVAYGPPGAISGVDVKSGGSGYVGGPLVTISGGGGSGAIGIANVGANGAVSSITVINGGSGYTSAPTVQILPAGYTPTPSDTSIASMMNSAWVAFANNPQNPGSNWTAYTPATNDASAPGAAVGRWANGGYLPNSATLNPVIKSAAKSNVPSVPMCGGLWFQQPPFAGATSLSSTKKK